VSAAEPGLSPEELLRQRAKGQRLVQEQTLKGGGLHGYTGIIAGTPAKRVALIYKDSRAYQFVAAVKGRGSLESEDQHFMQVINSFRPLAAAEAKLAQPLRVHLRQAKAGDKMAALATASKWPDDPQATLRLLNGLYPDGEPRPGDWLKILR
jgi:predicted Zn-dependent protease